LSTILKEISNDPALVENSWLYREPSVSRGVGVGTPSKRVLNQTSKDFIIAFEVSSPRAYEAKYRRPIWPKGQSGVTIGVGYDLRFGNRKFVDRDWPMLSVDNRKLLYSVVGLHGNDAKRALPSVHSVDIAWSDAESQFYTFLPFPTKETEDAFSNCD